MKTKVKGFYAILKREVIDLVKDSDIRILVLIAPLFYSIFYATIYLYKTEVEIPISVIDQNETALSRKYIKDLDAHQLIKVLNHSTDIKEGEKFLKDEIVQGVVIIPENFEENLKLGRHNTVKVLLNTHRFLHSNDINKAINEVGFVYAEESRMKVFNLKGVTPKQAEEMIEPVKEEMRFMYNPMLTYGDFLIPGVLMLILQQTLILGLAQSIAKERQEKRIRIWFENAHHSTSAAITGKTIVYFAFFMVYSFFFLTFHFWFFEVPSYSPLLNTIALTALFIFVNISFTVLIGSFFKSKLGVLQIIAFTSYPFFFLSGFAWPEIAFPESMKLLGDLLPIKPFLSAYMKTFRMGGDFSMIIPELRHLFVLAIGYSVLAYIRMRWVFAKTSRDERYARKLE
jgi:ABC-2 type transport system permease protein